MFWIPSIGRRVKVFRVTNPNNEPFLNRVATIKQVFPHSGTLVFDEAYEGIRVWPWNWSGLEPLEFTEEEIQRNKREAFADPYL